MSFRRLVIAVTFLAIFSMAVRVSVDTDTWWHLRAGEWMVENREVLQQDHFSLTRQGQPWINHSWLAQLILYEVFQLFGFAGLNLLTGVCVAASFLFIWLAMDEHPLIRAFVLILAAAAAGVYWAARPHILTFVFVGFYLWILARARGGRVGSLWALPFAMVFWVNLHGGYAVGLMLMGLYMVGEGFEFLVDTGVRKAAWREVWGQRKTFLLPLSGALCACLLAVMVNPNGPRMLLYPFETVSIGVLGQYIQEWQSPNFHTVEVQPFLWMLLSVLVALALSRRRASAVEMLLVCMFTYMALLAGRNVALFALVGAPVLARHGEGIISQIPRLGRRRDQVPRRVARWLNLLLLFLCLVAAGAKVTPVLGHELNEEAINERMPVSAVAFIQDNRPQGPLFNSYNWGGYVLWELWPDYQSYVDGRTDLFGDEVLSEYLSAWRGEESAMSLFTEFDVRLALLEPWAPLSHKLSASGWETLYEDDTAVVLAR